LIPLRPRPTLFPYTTLFRSNDGAATYEQDEEDENTFIFTIHDNVNWHDGEPVTAEDWLFAHEVISHPDYDGIRYGSDFTNIVGVDRKSTRLNSSHVSISYAV